MRSVVIHVTRDGQNVSAAQLRVSGTDNPYVGRPVATGADGTAKLRIRLGEYQVKATKKTLMALQPFSVPAGAEPVLVEIPLAKK